MHHRVRTCFSTELEAQHMILFISFEGCASNCVNPLSGVVMDETREGEKGNCANNTVNLYVIKSNVNKRRCNRDIIE